MKRHATSLIPAILLLVAGGAQAQANDDGVLPDAGLYLDQAELFETVVDLPARFAQGLVRTGDGYVCELEDGSSATSTTAEDAYALGVLHVLDQRRIGVVGHEVHRQLARHVPRGRRMCREIASSGEILRSISP